MAMARGTARGKQSGLESDGPFAFRFRFLDGKVVQGESYPLTRPATTRTASTLERSRPCIDPARPRSRIPP